MMIVMVMRWWWWYDDDAMMMTKHAWQGILALPCATLSSVYKTPPACSLQCTLCTTHLLDVQTVLLQCLLYTPHLQWGRAEPVYCTVIIQCTAVCFLALQCIVWGQPSKLQCNAEQSPCAHCTATYPVQYTVQPIWIINHAAVDQSLVTNMHAVYTCIQRGWPRELVYVWIFTTMQYAWHCKFWWLYDLSRLISPWMVFIKATSSYQEAPSEILYFFWRAF